MEKLKFEERIDDVENKLWEAMNILKDMEKEYNEYKESYKKVYCDENDEDLPSIFYDTQDVVEETIKSLYKTIEKVNSDC